MKVASFPKFNLLGHITFRVGPDGTDTYYIQFIEDYTSLIEDVKAKGWHVKEKATTIEITDPNIEPSNDDFFREVEIADGFVIVIQKKTKKAIITTAWS